MTKDYRVYAFLSMTVMLVLGFSIFQSFDNEYAAIQKEYFERAGVKDFEVGISQLNVKTPEGIHVDRCMTCHMGVANKKAAAFPQPLKTHPLTVPGRMREPHNFNKMGCVVCHEGNGRGLTTVDAHGATEHWTAPLLKGSLAQASCAKCHNTEGPDLAGAPLLNHGKKLFIEKVCWVCHTINGVSSGKKGPLLSDAGATFSLEYLRQSIVEPAANIATSKMPKFAWVKNETDVDALSVYLKSQRIKRIRSFDSAPVEYKPRIKKLQLPEKASAAEGVRILNDFSTGGLTRGGCINCHSYRTSSANLVGGDIAPELTYVARVRTEEYIRGHIKNPSADVVDTIMPRFDMLNKVEMDSLIMALQAMNFSPQKRTPLELYTALCSSCHGAKMDGKGRIGSLLDPLPRNLRKTQFTSSYSARLERSIAKGIPGTAMSSWEKLLSKNEIEGIVSLIVRGDGDESKSYKRLDPALPRIGDTERRSTAAIKPKLIARDSGRGKVVFNKFCTSCHGKLANGKGPVAYSLEQPLPRNLINRQFMNQKELDDKRLYQSILLGVPGTPMPSHDHLKDQDILDIIAYLRKLNIEPVKAKEKSE